ncbi:hypothetical protein K1719_026429 [Acacia pycnantha]|nr:hypothetical protein K1719_026429 [Acacia pycnantha]
MSMEKGQRSSGKTRAKAVQLNLGTPTNVQKGRALVGRLETDKNLNRGIVISMIKKGWGLDKVDIREPLISGLWVPRPHRDKIWVTMKYERLQNYCYDCGRIGHDSRNRKFQPKSTDEEEIDGRCGNNLGTPHVKTIDEALVVQDELWDEAAQLKPRPAVVAGQSVGRRVADVLPKSGNDQSQGAKSATHLSQGADLGNSLMQINDTIMGGSPSDQRCKGLPHFPIPIDVEGPRLNLHPNQIPPNPEHTIITSPESATLIQRPHYRVEFSNTEPHIQPPLNPLAGLSPISAVTTGVNRIQLKRSQDPCESDQNPSPLKRRLFFTDPGCDTQINPSEAPASSGGPHVTFRKLKNSIRGRKNNNKHQVKIYELTPITALYQDLPLQDVYAKNSENDSSTLETQTNADGCHQAAIGPSLELSGVRGSPDS